MSAEASALHKVIEGDPVEARRVLEDFLPGELIMFKDHLDTLASLIDEEIASQRSAVPGTRGT